MRSLTQYQEDSADFFCLLLSDLSGKLWFSRPSSARKRPNSAGLDFFTWTSSRAALFAPAEFTPSLERHLLNTFAFLLHFPVINHTHKNFQWTPSGIVDKLVFIIKFMSLECFVQINSNTFWFLKYFYTLVDSGHQPLPDSCGLMAAWQHGQTALQWEGSRCCQKQACHVFPPCRRIKLMPRSPPQAHQLLLVHAAIEKLTSSKQNKWQNATKGSSEWTGPYGAVFKEDLTVGPLPPKEGKAEKGDLDLSPR